MKMQTGNWVQVVLPQTAIDKDLAQLVGNKPVWLLLNDCGAHFAVNTKLEVICKDSKGIRVVGKVEQKTGQKDGAAICYDDNVVIKKLYPIIDIDTLIGIDVEMLPNRKMCATLDGVYEWCISANQKAYIDKIHKAYTYWFNNHLYQLPPSTIDGLLSWYDDAMVEVRERISELRSEIEELEKNLCSID